MALQYARFEMETAQGNEGTTTGVFATPFYLPAEEVALDPGVNTLDRSNELHGVDAKLPVAQNEYAPVGSVHIRDYANYGGFLLALLFGDVVSVAGDGIIKDPDGNIIPAGCWRHTFVKKSGQTPLSARVTLSYGAQWLQGRGVTCKDMAFTLDADGVQVQASTLANYVSRLTADPGYVPAQDVFSILPFRRRNTKITLAVAAGGASLGTSELESFGYTFNQDLEPVRDLGSFTGFPTETQRNNAPAGFLGLTGTFVRRQFDPDDWEYLISARNFSIRSLMQSEQNIGATAYPYRQWLEIPYGQLTGGTVEGLKHQPRHQDDVQWQAGYDDQAGYDFKVTLVNGIAAYK